MSSRGFSLIEISVVLALLGLIGGGLGALIMSLNRGVNKIAAEQQLISEGQQLITHIGLSASRAGYAPSANLRFEHPQDADAMPIATTARDHIEFCFSDHNRSRLHRFRTHNRHFQQNITIDNDCIGTDNWTDLTEPIMTTAAFSIPPHNPRILDVRLDIERHGIAITLRARLPLYSLISAQLP